MWEHSHSIEFTWNGETIGSNENNSEKKNSSKSTKGSCQANGSDSKDLSSAAIIILVIFLVSRSKKISKF